MSYNFMKYFGNLLYKEYLLYFIIFFDKYLVYIIIIMNKIV